MVIVVTSILPYTLHSVIPNSSLEISSSSPSHYSASSKSLSSITLNRLVIASIKTWFVSGPKLIKSAGE